MNEQREANSDAETFEVVGGMGAFGPAVRLEPLDVEPITPATVEVPWPDLATRVNEDAMRCALALSRNEMYEPTWFASQNPKTGEHVVVRATFPGERSE